MFHFVDEDEDDEEFLDLSDLDDEPLEVDGLEFAFEGAVPKARSITDKEVQTKSKRTRNTRVKNMSYDGKREAGWSFYCAHKTHLPNLCERAMDEREVTCTCECHEDRQYVQSESRYVPGSDDEEILFLFD